MMRRVARLAMVAVATWVGTMSANAHASGAHAVSFLEARFVYEHEETSRKIMRDAAQSDRFFAAKMEHSTRVFFSALPRLERFLGDAKAHGIVVQTLPLRTLRSESDTLQSAEALRKLSAVRLPATLRLPLDTQVHLDFLTVSLEKPLDAAQAAWLWAQLPQLAFVALEKDQAAQDALGDTKPTTSIGFGTVRTAPSFALWVGSTEEIRPQNEPAFRAQAEALADDVFPALKAAFTDDKLASLIMGGDRKRLVAPQSKLALDGNKYFNPWGPLLDDVGMRVGSQAGRLHARVLLTVDHAWGGKPGDPVPAGLQQYLDAIVQPAAERAREIDAQLAKLRAAKPDDRASLMAPLERLAKDPVLRTVGGQRVIDALAKEALTGTEPTMQKLAIEQLRWIDAPDRDRVYFELLRTRRHVPYLSVIAQSFGERPDDKRVDALIAVLNDATVTDDARSWAKNGLRTAASYAKKGGPLKPRIDAALAAVK